MSKIKIWNSLSPSIIFLFIYYNNILVLVFGFEINFGRKIFLTAKHHFFGGHPEEQLRDRGNSKFFKMNISFYFLYFSKFLKKKKNNKKTLFFWLSNRYNPLNKRKSYSFIYYVLKTTSHIILTNSTFIPIINDFIPWKSFLVTNIRVSCWY